MKLARGRAAIRSVRYPVDHRRTSAANAFAAIVVKRDRLFARHDQLLVDFVQHFQERHVGINVMRKVRFDRALLVR